MRRIYLLSGLLVPLVLMGTALKGQTIEAQKPTDAFQAARDYVEKSDRYLHHSKLKRGMKGYGLTVLAGTKIVRFDVEIVSVITNWSAKQDVIFAMLSGCGLEKSGIISGMSGSPVFIRDPADGKDKMIGAVAYGYRGQTVPQTGIQPITQMLVMSGIPQGKPFGGKDRPAVSKTAAISREKLLAAAMKPGNTDILKLIRPRVYEAFALRRDAEAPRLTQLTTPLMVSGLNEKMLIRLEKRFKPLGFMPMQSGGVGGADAEAAMNIKLEPGSAVSIPLVTGDVDMSATGTVTEVIGNNVLAFGHAFFGEGPVEFPMGTAYVHTVVPHLLESFKLSSTLKITGKLVQDEQVAVGGIVGEKVSMIPMTVSVHWKQDGRKQKFSYNLVRHHWWTAIMATMYHKVSIDFGKLGKFTVENTEADSGTWGVYSDTVRPLATLLNNPYGDPARVKSIDVKMEIKPKDRSASIIKLKLDGRIYKPGDTVTGKLTLRPFKQNRKEVAVSFKLPDDIEEGRYALTACNGQAAAEALVNEMPHRFNPKNLEELFGAMKDVTRFKGDKLYLRLPMVQTAGLALGKDELPDLPPSKASMIVQSGKLDTKIYIKSLVRDVQSEYVLNGSAAVSFEVQDKPGESLIDKQRNQ